MAIYLTGRILAEDIEDARLQIIDKLKAEKMEGAELKIWGAQERNDRIWWEYIARVEDKEEG